MCLEGIQLYFMLIEVFEAERSRVRWFYAFGYGGYTVKVLKFGTPQTVAIIVLKIEKFDVTLH